MRLAVSLVLPRLAVMQAGTGKMGISAMKGWEARDPQSQNGRGREGQPGAREGQQQEAEDLSASSQASSRG